MTTNAQIVDLAKRIADKAALGDIHRAQAAEPGWLSNEHYRLAAMADDDVCELCERMRRLIKLGDEEGLSEALRVRSCAVLTEMPPGWREVES